MAATLGQRLRRLRRQRLLTLRELAAKSGVSIGTIHRIENDRGIPRLRTLRRLAAALEVPPEALAPDEPDEHDDQ